MGNWSTGGVALEPFEFDGDMVQVTISRMRVEDMSALTPYITEGKLAFNNPMDACKVAADILPKYLISVSGITKQDGSQMMLAELKIALGELYFMRLASKLFAELMMTGTVGGASKNLPPPLPA